MSGSTISTSDTRIEALSLQSSAYGVPLNVLYGVNRVKGNLVWYGGFKATPITSTQSAGGKGGGVKTQNTTFNYTASVIMGLCEGQITGIPRAWKGKQLYSGATQATSIATATETYAVPASGPMVFTVAHSAAWLSVVAVTQPYSYVVSLESGDTTVNLTTPLANGADYSASNGVVTILNAALRGITVSVTYQWASAAITQSPLQQLGLTFGAGALGQAVWSPLSTIAPAQAIGYSGLAYVAGQDYQLGSGAQVDNHTFEVQGPQAYSIGATVPDANPALAAYDLITNARFGANFPSAQVAGVNDWSTYCLASGLLMSPLLETQMQAGDFLTQMAVLTNTAPVWSNGRLKMIPYGDTAMTANGATFTPNNTPLWDLTDNDFAPSQGAEPIRVTRKAQADAFNTVKIEFLNRGNLYNIEIAEAKDSANIDLYGLRVMPTVQAHWVCEPVVARAVAQLILQRVLYVRNTYQFNLGWPKIFLEPMDLVTLTDTALGFNKLPVRITSVEESESGDLVFEAEDFPLGTANAATYQSQLGAGFQHDYNAAPGSASAPVIFEAPGALTQNGLELYVAATGAGAAWGGCTVYVSLDGLSYKRVGTINGGSRYGSLSASCAASGTVAPVLFPGGTLTSGSVADAAALNTLCYVGGASKEFFAFNVATLVSAYQYNLTGSTVRGAYGTTAAAHTLGDPFVRVDNAIAKSGAIDLGYIGKTVHVKLTSFNVYGAAEESLASVTDYTYTITGAFIYGNTATAEASDVILSIGKKTKVSIDQLALLAENSSIVPTAASWGVSSAAYTTAYNAWAAYLATLTTPVPWYDFTSYTTIVGATWRTKWGDLYAARDALLDAINKAALVSGGGNLLAVGAFSYPGLYFALGWAGVGSGYTAVQSAPGPVGGGLSQKLSWSAALSVPIGVYTSSAVLATYGGVRGGGVVGQTYVISFYTKCLFGYTGAVTVQFNNGTVVPLTNPNVSYVWQRHSFRITVTSLSADPTQLILATTTTPSLAAGQLEFANAKVEEGYVLTPFSEVTYGPSDTFNLANTAATGRSSALGGTLTLTTTDQVAQWTNLVTKGGEVTIWVGGSLAGTGSLGGGAGGIILRTTLWRKDPSAVYTQIGTATDRYCSGTGGFYAPGEALSLFPVTDTPPAGINRYELRCKWVDNGGSPYGVSASVVNAAIVTVEHKV